MSAVVGVRWRSLPALQSSDVKPLQEYVPQLVVKMKNLTELYDVNSDLQFASQIKIHIDRDKAIRLMVKRMAT